MRRVGPATVVRFRVVTIVLGFLAQAAALTVGGIARAQPLLVAELPFALLGSIVFHMRPRGVEWTRRFSR